jgi:hypothetical protein
VDQAVPVIRSRGPGDELVRAVLRPRRVDVALGAALAVVHQICEALVAVVIGIVIDEAIGTGDAAGVAVWLGGLAAVFAVLATSAMYGYRARYWPWRPATRRGSVRSPMSWAADCR